MARVWIEDRETHADYQLAMENWQAAKRKGSKRQPPAGGGSAGMGRTTRGRRSPSRSSLRRRPRWAR